MRSAAFVVLVAACSGPADTAETGDSAVDTSDTSPPCAPEGAWDCPIAVEAFPYSDARDTTDAPESVVDAYACAPATDESGGEFVYRVEVPAEGALVVRVDDVSGDDVDVDVHLLESADPDTCRARDNRETSWIVEPGTWYVVVDTWAQNGTEFPGAYVLDISFAAAPTGRCAFAPRDLRMFWDDCAPGIDCAMDGADVLLHTPSAGPVVQEAHLVTVADDFGGGWPTSFTDQIDAHYALSEAATGYVMDRGEPWAPSGEGGSEFGQGATGDPLPVLDEAWYVNMYWRDKPAKGTRMLVWNPATGGVVVASGGYETGPGANDAIGGATEEVHDVLGTGHRDSLVIGFAADASLPLGPIDCN